MLDKPLIDKCVPCPEPKPKVIVPLVQELCPKPVEPAKVPLLGTTKFVEVITDLYPEYIRKLFNDFDCTNEEMIGDFYRVPEISAPPPSGIIEQPFTFKFVTRYGEAPFLYSIFSGELPDGLVLQETGVLSGTPHVDGNFNLVIKVKDNRGNSNKMIVNLKIMV